MSEAIAHLEGADPVLRDIIQRVGLSCVAFHDPTFANLMYWIVFQGLNESRASRNFGRLLEAAGSELTPESILAIGPQRLRELGLSRQKAACMTELARRTAEGAIDFPAIADLTDEEVMETLTEVKGIGPWTVQMFLIFALRRPDVLPTGDFGVREAIKREYGLPEQPEPMQIEALARDRGWHPHCSLASRLLWCSLGPPWKLPGGHDVPVGDLGPDHDGNGHAPVRA